MAVNQLIVFNGFYETDVQGTPDWQALPLAVMALRNDGASFGQEFMNLSVDAKKDNIFMADILGTSQGVEIDATGYTRTSLATGGGRNINVQQSPTDLGEWKISETSIQFGGGANIGAGQTIEGIVIYSGDATSTNDATNRVLMMQEFSAAEAKLTADGPVTVNFTNQTLWFKLQG